jgi:hypothetical protein
MLIVYLEPFQQPQHQLLLLWGPHVRAWPRSWSQQDNYNAAIPLDWWLLFSNVLYADMWLLRYPESSRIIRTLFDE